MDEREERAAVTMMEAVALFELGRGLAAGKRAGVEQAVGGIEHPDGDEHRGGRGPGKMEGRRRRRRRWSRQRRRKARRARADARARAACGVAGFVEETDG